MDIAPTRTMYQGTNQEFATKYMRYVIHSTCEDFRAAADIDPEMNRADDKAGKTNFVHFMFSGEKECNRPCVGCTCYLAGEVRRIGDGKGARSRSLSAGGAFSGSPRGTARPDSPVEGFRGRVIRWLTTMAEVHRRVGR